MNKQLLIEEIADHSKESKATVKRVLESFMDVVTAALKKNQSVVLTGFGTFSVMQRQARTGVNPATGKKMTIKAKKVPKFKPGKALKDMIA